MRRTRRGCWVAEFRLQTERLVLRSWRDGDRAAFAAICADPKVMATLGPVMDRMQSDALIDQVKAKEAAHGHTFWALERCSDTQFIGWCGVIRGDMPPIDGKAEIGWRLSSNAWGHGFATEAARATLDWLFANRDDSAALAITHSGNLRSRAVMQRLGMVYCPELDFAHPKLAESNPLRPHVTYSLARDNWMQQ